MPVGGFPLLGIQKLQLQYPLQGGHTHSLSWRASFKSSPYLGQINLKAYIWIRIHYYIIMHINYTCFADTDHKTVLGFLCSFCCGSMSLCRWSSAGTGGRLSHSLYRRLCQCSSRLSLCGHCKLALRPTQSEAALAMKLSVCIHGHTQS